MAEELSADAVDAWVAEAEDADRRLAALCTKLGLPVPYLGQPLNAVYVAILEKIYEAYFPPSE